MGGQEPAASACDSPMFQEGPSTVQIGCEMKRLRGRHKVRVAVEAESHAGRSSVQIPVCAREKRRLAFWASLQPYHSGDGNVQSCRESGVARQPILQCDTRMAVEACIIRPTRILFFLYMLSCVITGAVEAG